MSATHQPPASLSVFSTTELDMLAKTADAMSAYLGRPVLVEVGKAEEGTEWATFGVALDTDGDEADDDQPHVQMGGPGARLLGGRGGLPDSASQAYDCVYLWAVQITLVEGERFVKLDQEGEECAWSDELEDMLPFAFSDEAPEDEDEDDEDDDDDDNQDDPDDDALRRAVPPSPHRH
ncbi:hypothetical protein CEG14_04760 [Bordetella genomosp. 1]|uniref:Uncharacterized protein n=1 Tax=Bordetella genomosp. 1 TaxID=1395607 RepID=A0A261SW19_9BORD|nr:hypothetical protein [Bordetella genomosp. 1]OZI41060.1 hypothetical protein CEG14_04760 [Bordetella genomosp. 1]OZI69251.1 hypothetical protein CAL27_07380 [Bordetella genomosp. 1]